MHHGVGLGSQRRRTSKGSGVNIGSKSQRVEAAPSEAQPVGTVGVGQRRHAEGRVLAGQDRLHRRLQGPGQRARAASRRLNVDGDGQGDLAGHGGEQRAVFVYQIDSYRYWERELGRDDFVYGQFGENFTVDGLGRRRGLHRRPLPDRQRGLRGHPAAGHLLPRRDPHERPAHPRAARLPPPPGLLLPRARRGRGRRPATRSSRSPPGPSR